MRKIFLAFVALSISGCSPPQKPKKASEQTAKVTPSELHFLEDAISVKGLVLRVDNAGGYSKYPSSRPGSMAIAVDYTITNNSDKPLSVSDTPQVKLIDAAGTEYKADVEATTAYYNQKTFTLKGVSDLSPGLSETGGIAFEVAQARFDPHTWRIVIGKKVVAFCVRKEAVNGDCAPKRDSSSASSAGS